MNRLVEWRRVEARIASALDDANDGGTSQEWLMQLVDADERNEALEADKAELVEALVEALPRNVCLTNRNIRDDMTVPLETTMGELRKIAALLNRIEGESR